MLPNRSIRLASALTILVVLIAAIPSATAEAKVRTHRDCEDATACSVHEVRIDGCRNTSPDKCEIKRGRSPIISFDYTPSFESTSAHGQVYWVSPEGDLPFVDMNTDACQHTTCPISSGTRQTYTYRFETSRKYQARAYEIKWKLTNPETQKMCCFQTTIQLVK